MVTPAAALELDASRALYAARMLEAALHSEGLWEMQWGEVRVPAIREVTERGVVFTATFPSLCWLSPPSEGVLILLDGEVMGMQRVDHPGDTQFVVTWELGTTKVKV